MSNDHSDALVFFGATGDLAYKKIFPSLQAMVKAGTGAYIKIGTSGTGGMGLNIPYTHSEEKPSRVLLSKSALAGAQTLLLFLMARTPGGPITQEIKQLMDKADQGAGGAIVNVLSYKADHVAATEQIKLIEAAARSKNCETPANWRSNSVVR